MQAAPEGRRLIGNAGIGCASREYAACKTEYSALTALRLWYVTAVVVFMAMEPSTGGLVRYSCSHRFSHQFGQ
jgi:hypothetical protein